MDQNVPFLMAGSTEPQFTRRETNVIPTITQTFGLEALPKPLHKDVEPR